tara:strand:- start:276 stop:410 length:135 start_codon:yes stop_codon:yes gene_type:complete
MPPAIGAWKIGNSDTNPIFNCGSTEGHFKIFCLLEVKVRKYKKM